MKKLSKPADALQSYLKDYQISIAQLAKEIKLSQSIVRQLTMGKAKISLNTAARLAKYFGTTIEFWTDLQYASDRGELKGDAALNDILKDIVKAKKPKEPPKKAGKAEKVAVKTGPAKNEKTADAPDPAKRGRKAATVAEDSAPKTRGRKPAEAKAAEEPAKPARKPRAKKEETAAAAAATVKAEPKKRGRKPKAKPAEEPELQKVFKPRVELIKKKDLEKPLEEPWVDDSDSDDSPVFSSFEPGSSDQGQTNDEENHDDSDLD
jgi:addiction module HigA family antidote